MTTMQMYWLVMLDSIIKGTVGLLVLSLLGTAVAIMAWCDRDVRGWVPLSFLATAAFMALVATFTPSTKQMAAILVIPRIVNNEKVQKAGDQLYDLATEWMEELRPKKKEGTSEASGGK